MRNATAILTALLVLTVYVMPLDAPAAVAKTTDSGDFTALKKLAAGTTIDEAKKQGLAFLRQWPNSRHVPDVRILLADLEASPEEAVKKYRLVVDLYRYYPRRDYALNRICEIRYLQSKWDELSAAAREGLSFPKSGFLDRFRSFQVISLMHLGRYDEAESECRAMIDLNHDYHNLARSLLMLAHIYRTTSGMSREYIRTVREIAMGYGESDALPATLYLLGDFYEQKKMHDESYSAYSDLVARYPGSPEAAEAKKRIAILSKHNPRHVFYLPDKTIVDRTENIEIQPEMNVPETEKEATAYSVSVGPFPSASKAAEIRRLLSDFESITTVRLRKGFALYVGRCADEETALTLRIRLAEEFGINGRIVRISDDGPHSYIYGE